MECTSNSKPTNLTCTLLPTSRLEFRRTLFFGGRFPSASSATPTQDLILEMETLRLAIVDRL
jgi:hypothetical protein